MTNETVTIVMMAMMAVMVVYFIIDIKSDEHTNAN